VSRQPHETLAIDVAHVIGDFFDASDLEVLAHLDRADKFSRLEQGFVGPGIEPGIAAPEPLDHQQPALEVDVVDIGDFELAACGGFERGCDLDHRRIVKIAPVTAQ